MKKTKEQKPKTVGADAPSVRPSTKAGQNRGITLIAIVITIIVMLILVAVTISMAINGGLFGYAGKAAGDTQNAIDAEQELGSGKVQIDGVWYDSIDDYLAGKPSSGAGDGEEGVEGGLQIELSIAGEKGTTVPVPTGFEHVEGTIDEGYVIEDEDGNQFVWVPVEANQKMTLKITSDKDIKNVNLIDPYGDIILTIEDENIQKTYNNTQIEPTINGMYMAQVTTEDRMLEKKLTVKSLYAIDAWNDYKTTDEYWLTETNGEQNKVQFWENVAEINGHTNIETFIEQYGFKSLDQCITTMSKPEIFRDLGNYTESIEKNKGFYIARYEAGTSTNRRVGDEGDDVLTIISEHGIPVSKEGFYPYNLITHDQAKDLAKRMYSSTEFSVDLLTGSAWDRTLSWIYETKNKTVKEILENSISWGNYYDAEFEVTKGEYSTDSTGTYKTISQTYMKEAWKTIALTTGATTIPAKRNSANNIFDLAGNVREWTNEVNSSDIGSYRGGGFLHQGTNVAHIRGNGSGIGLYDSGIGFRVALYLQ